MVAIPIMNGAIGMSHIAVWSMVSVTLPASLSLNLMPAAPSIADRRYHVPMNSRRAAGVEPIESAHGRALTKHTNAMAGEFRLEG